MLLDYIMCVMVGLMCTTYKPYKTIFQVSLSRTAQDWEMQHVVCVSKCVVRYKAY